ncbi:MAG: hypothetical protein AAF986_03365 [Pseudomonadota bacterium]
MRIQLLALTFIASMAAACVGVPPAHAGEWRLNPHACPDLKEDIRDERVDYSRRDVREDRRDRRTIRCPARAWTYVPGRFERTKKRPTRPTYSAIYIDRRGHYYGVRGKRNVRIKLRY